MDSEATVAGLQICPGHRQSMKAVPSVQAIENQGLEGDRHARPDSARQVLLIELETLEKLDLRAGDVKENITTRGIGLMQLPVGTRLHIGGAVLELTGQCHPCSRMDEIRAGLLAELGGRRGVLARVAQTGTMRVGDAITIEAAPAQS